MSTTELARAADIARELNIAVFARLDTHPEAGRQRYRCAVYLAPSAPAQPLDDEGEATSRVAAGHGFWFNWDCGYGAPAPEPAQVLNTLAQDAAGLENARGLPGWAADMGLDPFAPETSELHGAVARQTEQLQALLIDLDTYHRLLWG